MPGWNDHFQKVLIAALTFIASFGQVQPLFAASLFESQFEVNLNPAASFDLTQQPAPQNLSDIAQKTDTEAFAEGVRRATRAANLAQTAKTSQQWNDVAVAWLEAVTWMQAVPPGNPKRELAQRKVVEYLRNFAIARQKAASLTSNLPFPSFNSEVLDEKLLLYLSYLAAVGPPDILIVGSSRALQGFDPSALQSALATRGYSGLKVFNFAINGATAQVVDWQIRVLLSAQQLPKLIVWADGARALNNGRVDRTFNAIISSPGYRSLRAGKRPTLSLEDLQQDLVAGNFSEISEHFSHHLSTFKQAQQEPNLWAFSGKNQETVYASSDVNIYETEDPASTEIALAIDNILKNEPANMIDANGFLEVTQRFNPQEYYWNNPKVSGRYDADYSAFQVGGKQGSALNDLVYFTTVKNIPLIFVNLPLTQDYLDPIRTSAEQKFVQYMQAQARQKGFIFRNFSNTNLRKNHYFADPSHLNVYGAIAVAQQLANDQYIIWPRR